MEIVPLHALALVIAVKLSLLPEADSLPKTVAENGSISRNNLFAETKRFLVIPESAFLLGVRDFAKCKIQNYCSDKIRSEPRTGRTKHSANVECIIIATAGRSLGCAPFVPLARDDIL